MKADRNLMSGPAEVAAEAATAEKQGYDGLWAAEFGHDPFLPLAVATTTTTKVTLATGIAVAFARNPMTLAMEANDLQILAQGRFVLGVGSQVKPHIEKRYSMTWSHPADRMRELILALHAIWESWNKSTRLSFRGQFYTHTLSSPMFNPGPSTYPTPPIVLAAVGPKMTAVAGEVADGLLIHSFTTAKYLNDVTIPAFTDALSASGRPRTAAQVIYPGMVATGQDEQSMTAAVQAVRRQIAFYGTTPSYRPVLAHHNWEDLQVDLNVLAKQGNWEQMIKIIDDDVVGQFATVAPLDQLAASIKDRYGKLVDRFNFYAPPTVDPDAWSSVLAELKSDKPSTADAPSTARGA
jgi:probable F420-dependent oxidoreductase